MHSRIRKDCFDFGAEEQCATVVSIVQRLNAQPVTRDEQSFSRSVPDGKGEHSTQVLDTLRPILLIQVDDAFGVAVGTIAMTAHFKILAQVLMVVDFAVEDDPDAAKFITERLVASLNIDDAEAAHSETDVVFDK